MWRHVFVCMFIFVALTECCGFLAAEAITAPPCPAVDQVADDTAAVRDQLRQRIRQVVNTTSSASSTPATSAIVLASGIVAPVPRVSLPPMDVSVASFLGVMPGTTTLAQVVSLWGEPQRATDFEGKTAHLYSTEELSHIEVLFESGKVASILIKLDMPLAASQVRESLQEELQLVAPVMIPDEHGKFVGELFPERGVFFLFANSPSSREQLVSQIGIEPVSADSFVLRGESTWQSRPSEAMRDFLYAAKLVPNEAKTHWFLAKIFLMQGNISAALQSAERAIALDEKRPAYHLTLAQVLIQLNRANEARQYLEETLTIAEVVPHEKALILVTLGDLYRTAAVPQCEKAMDIHGEAIRIAAQYLESPNKTIRSVAQEAAFQSHLSAARDVACGDWNNKDDAISCWLERAAVLAATDDETIPIAVIEERLFQLAVCALATQVGTTNTTALEGRIEEVLAIGHDLIVNTDDQIRQQKYYREMGLALYDAVQIFQQRNEFPQALRYGEQSARLMDKGISDSQRSQQSVESPKHGQNPATIR